MAIAATTKKTAKKMKNRLLKLTSLTALMLAVLLSGSCKSCSDEELSDEDQIKKVISQIQLAVETKQIGEISQYLSKNYNDKAGNSRDTVKRYLFIYLKRFDKIRTLITFDDGPTVNGDSADVKITVRAGAAEKGDLLPSNADKFRFNLIFTKEDGEWRILKNNWDQSFGISP